MRQLVYCVAASLDGFIAGPNDEHDWIVPDSGIDFHALHSRFDTMLMGRRSYEAAFRRGDLLTSMGMRIVVVSTTLGSRCPPEIKVVSRDVAEAVRTLKAEAGKDIWLSGGGVLFRNLLDMGLVDAVEVSVFPILLGAGTPLLPEGRRAFLQLSACNALPSGVLMLSYLIPGVQTATPPQAE